MILSRQIAGSRLAIVPERGTACPRKIRDGSNAIVLEFLGALDTWARGESGP